MIELKETKDGFPIVEMDHLPSLTNDDLINLRKKALGIIVPERAEFLAMGEGRLATTEGFLLNQDLEMMDRIVNRIETAMAERMMMIGDKPPAPSAPPVIPGVTHNSGHLDPEQP